MPGNRMSAALVAVAGLAAVASATVRPAQVIVKEGDVLDDSVVSTLNTPFTNGNGQVGFVIGLADGTRSVWYDTGSIWNSATALPDSITGAEGTMGISNAGNFIISPTFNGFDAVYGDGGLILHDETAAPGLPGFDTTFHSRPRMVADGTAYWIGGINDGAGGTSTQNRVLWRRDTSGTVSAVLKAGDVLGGKTVATGSSNIDYFFGYSDDNTQSLFMFNDAAQGTNFDDTLVVNNVFIAQEGSATGQGDNWDNFDVSDINNAGNYIFSGDTDGTSSSDEFLAYNGNIVLREDDVVDGLTLGGSMNAASINNNNEAAFIWSTDEESETLFYASDAASMGSAIKLLSVGDELDTDNNGTADWLVTDFNASNIIGPGLDFASDGYIYVEIDMNSADGSITGLEAIIRLRVPAPATLAPLAGLGLFGLRRRR